MCLSFGKTHRRDPVDSARCAFAQGRLRTVPHKHGHSASLRRLEIDRRLAETRNVRVLTTGLVWLALAGLMATAQTPPSANSTSVAKRQSEIKKNYLTGEAALNAGDLDAAEASFKEVLNLDP